MGSANHNSGESGEWQMMNFQPMPLLKRASPFDDPDWILVLHFCGIHSRFRVTPAMEVGLMEHIWSVEELVGLLESAEARAA